MFSDVWFPAYPFIHDNTYLKLSFLNGGRKWPGRRRKKRKDNITVTSAIARGQSDNITNRHQQQGTHGQGDDITLLRLVIVGLTVARPSAAFSRGSAAAAGRGRRRPPTAAARPRRADVCVYVCCGGFWFSRRSVQWACRVGLSLMFTRRNLNNNWSSY